MLHTPRKNTPQVPTELEPLEFMRDAIFHYKIKIEMVFITFIVSLILEKLLT